MRIGVAHHYGWAAVVVADDDHAVVDRRRIELIEPGLPVAPVHHEGGTHPMHRTGPDLDDQALGALVEQVRASVLRASSAALAALEADLPGPVASLSLARWDDLPVDIAQLRRPPHESRADSVMYRQVLAGLAAERGWAIHRYDAKRVEAEASALLGERADQVLHGPRALLGAPWGKDQRIALAATVVAAQAGW